MGNMDGNAVLKAQTYDSDVVQTVVSSSKDALGLLFKAAEHKKRTPMNRRQPLQQPEHMIARRPP